VASSVRTPIFELLRARGAYRQTLGEHERDHIRTRVNNKQELQGRDFARLCATNRDSEFPGHVAAI
jgi:hypothetical protein